MKVYQLIIEEDRSGSSPSLFAGDVAYNDLDDALQDLKDEVTTAKTDPDGNFGWLADAFVEHPEHMNEKWHSERHVVFDDGIVGDHLEMYIHEVTII